MPSHSSRYLFRNDNRMTVFTEISVATDGEAAEAVAEVLRPFAYQDGVVFEQLGAAHDPHPDAVEPTVTVKIYVPQKDDTPELRRRIEEILYHLNRLYPIPPPSFHILEEKDWAHAWKEHYHPFRIGKRIWIRPSWYESEETSDENGVQAQADDIVLVLDPGMAFGTGLHPTTQNCLLALEELVQDRDNVLDVGTGSGILAIAALKLGAERAVGVDTDELAVKTAYANGQQNLVGQQFEVWQGDLSTVVEQDWDIVLVNILAPIITNLLLEGHLLDYVAKSGWLVLSGIIDAQVEDVEAAVTKMGAKIVDRIIVRDWVTLLVRRD